MESIKRLPPYLEGLQKRLLQTMFGVFDGETQTSPGLIDKPLDLHETKIAGWDSDSSGGYHTLDKFRSIPYPLLH